MMTARPFLAPLAVFAAGLLAINIAIEPASAKSHARVHFDAVGSASGVSDLFLGSSVVANSIDTAAWDRARPGARALNAGFNATFSVEHNILLRRARHLQPAAIYYGFTDLELSESADDSNPRLTMYGSVIDSQDPDTAIRLRAGDAWLTRWRMRLEMRVPMFKHRYSAWGRVERLRRRLATIGWPYAEPAPQFEPRDLAAFTRAVGRIAGSGEPLSEPVRDLLSVASGMTTTTGLRPAMYVVEMPTTTRHRERFLASPEWLRYRALLESRLRALDVIFIDASAWSRDDEFADSIHLGPTGAARFTARLEQALKEK